MLSFPVAKGKREMQSGPEFAVSTTKILLELSRGHSPFGVHREETQCLCIKSILNISYGNMQMLFHGLLFMSQWHHPKEQFGRITL